VSNDNAAGAGSFGLSTVKEALMEPRPWHQHYDDGVPVSMEYPKLALDQLLKHAVDTYDRDAIVFFGNSITFKEFDALVDRLAAALQGLGLQKGDRVSVYMANCPQTVMAYYAIWRAGGVAVPSNPLYTAAEFAHQARDAGSKIVICMSLMYPRVAEARSRTELQHVVVTNIKEYFPPLLNRLFTLLKEKKGGHRVDISGAENTHWFQDLLAGAPDKPEPVAVSANDTAVLMYTGGTTGLPKGAVLNHSNLIVNARQCGAWTVGLIKGEEIMLTALPLTHSYAMTVCMNMSIDRGYTQVMVADPRDIKGLLHVIDKHRTTVFPGVPALYAAISNHPKAQKGKVDLSSIKQCISGAAGLPAEVQRRFQELTGGRLVEGYGLSEASPVTHCNPLEGEDRLGTIGMPFPDTDSRIVDEATETKVLETGERGVLCIAGPQVMSGYWKQPEETKNALHTDESGITWLHTGDIAVMDPDGFFQIVDRKKDMILASGGFNVYPREVEDVLFEHPAVREAGVIGVPVDETDQRVKAFVVLKEGADASAEDIIAFCRERMAKFKVPKHIEFLDELPKTFVGKVLRRELAEKERSGKP
jgi:long-chain acyl-CoA synthetase